MNGRRPVPFTLWDAPKGGRLIGLSRTGSMTDVEWIDESAAGGTLWIGDAAQVDTPESANE